MDAATGIGLDAGATNTSLARRASYTCVKVRSTAVDFEYDYLVQVVHGEVVSWGWAGGQLLSAVRARDHDRFAPSQADRASWLPSVGKLPRVKHPQA